MGQQKKAKIDSKFDTSMYFMSQKHGANFGEFMGVMATLQALMEGERAKVWPQVKDAKIHCFHCFCYFFPF